MCGGVDFLVDMHRIGEAIAGVVADRDFEHTAFGVEVTPDDAQHRRGFVDLQLGGESGVGGDRLDVLRDFADFDARQRLDLPEQGARAQIKLVDRVFQGFVKIGVSHRQRQSLACVPTHPAKARPIAFNARGDLLGNLAWQGRDVLLGVGDFASARVLQKLTDIRKRLVQRTATRSGRLHRGARSSAPLNQAFDFKFAQRLAHRETAHVVLCAQDGFGRERFAAGVFAFQNRFAKLGGQLQVTRRARDFLSRARFSHLGVRLGRQSLLHRPFAQSGGRV
mgnify:CR=1 FL=1